MKSSPASGGCLCHECGMDRYTKTYPVGDSESPLIVFISGMPSIDHANNKITPYGRSGRVIRQTLSTTGLDTTRIFYTYACLCRSDKKNSPKIKSVRACNIRLHRELRKANPKIVVPLGRGGLLAMDSKGSIKRDRGVFQEKNGYKIIPTIDPENLYTNPDAAIDLIKDLTFIANVIQGKTEPVSSIVSDIYEFIEDQYEFNYFIERMREVRPKEAAIDLETTGFDPEKDRILSMSITIEENQAFVIDWIGLIANNKKNKTQLDKFLQFVECIYHNGMFDDLFLQANGMMPNFVHDTMLSSYNLDERQGGHSLKRIVQDKYHPPRYEDKLSQIVCSRRLLSPNTSAPPFTTADWSDPVSREAIADYNGADSDYTFRIHKDFQKSMEEDNVDHIPKKILIPGAKHFIRFKQDGLLVDIPYLESLGKKWAKEIRNLETKIRSLSGAQYLNLDSVPQVQDYIFKKLKLKPMSENLDQLLDQDEILEEISAIENPEAQEYWHTASSAVFSNMKPHSTSMYMLYWLAEQHPFPKYLLKYRLVQKKFGTYYEGYKKLIDSTNHLRPSYKLHGTRTGRLSSEDPNIHGMPRINDIKRMIIAESGYTMIDADYSQAEIRMMAHFAEDETLIQKLHELDIHRAISLVLFNTSEEDMSKLTKEEQKIRRRAAKTIAFGLIYGRGVKSLATQMNVDIKEADEFISRFFLMMPRVRSWIAKQHSLVIRNGEVVSLYGRKRRFPFIPNKKIASKVKRQAVNSPIQSSVSDMTLLANIDIIHELNRRRIPNKVGYHIHDGFMFQTPDEHVEEAVDITRTRMTNVDFDTEVPFVADVQIGKTWGDLVTI